MQVKTFLEVIERHGACDDAQNWIRANFKDRQDAERVWMSCTNFGWLTWLACRAKDKYKDNEKLRWHFGQTILDWLGADYVFKHGINKPLKQNRADLVDKLYSLRQAETPYSPRLTALRCLEDLLPPDGDALWAMDWIEATHPLNDALCLDLRHCISFEEVLSGLRY